jgi:hypothetical protein
MLMLIGSVCLRPVTFGHMSFSLPGRRWTLLIAIFWTRRVSRWPILLLRRSMVSMLISAIRLRPMAPWSMTLSLPRRWWSMLIAIFWTRRRSRRSMGFSAVRMVPFRNVLFGLGSSGASLPGSCAIVLGWWVFRVVSRAGFIPMTRAMVRLRITARSGVCDAVVGASEYLVVLTPCSAYVALVVCSFVKSSALTYIFTPTSHTALRYSAPVARTCYSALVHERHLLAGQVGAVVTAPLCIVVEAYFGFISLALGGAALLQTCHEAFMAGNHLALVTPFKTRICAWFVFARLTLFGGGVCRCREAKACEDSQREMHCDRL